MDKEQLVIWEIYILYGQDIIIMVEDNINFIECMRCVIQAGYLVAVMLSGDNEGFKT